MVRICLNMIVKNESHIIAETLEKLISKIKFDHYIISDTGSDDNTPEIIKNFFNEHGISGSIYHDTWRDFGHNRTLALKYAKGVCDYLFIFDADDTIVGDFVIPEKLDHDAYYLKFGDLQNNYQRFCLVKSSLEWEYIGVLHEYISCKIPITESTILGNYFIISGRTSSRNKDPEKYLKDAKILEKGYYSSLQENTNLFNRYAYYCANSYLDAGDKPNAIKWYLKTLECQGWFEERYNACIKLGDLLEGPEKWYYYLESYRHTPKRVEGILKLIVHYSCEQSYSIAWAYYTLIQDYYENEYLTDNLSTRLFAVVNDYSFYLPYYMIIVCEKLGRTSVGLKMYSIIFEKKALPGQWWIDNLIYNYQFYDTKSLRKKMENYIEFLKQNGYTESPQWKPTLRLISAFKIFIYTGFSEKAWNYTWALDNAIGGSERAVMSLAKALGDYTIIIAGDVIPEIVENMTFVDRTTGNNILKSTHFDIIIVIGHCTAVNVSIGIV